MNLLLLVLSISQIEITRSMDNMEPTEIVVKVQNQLPLDSQTRHRLFRNLISLVIRKIIIIKYQDHFLVINQKRLDFPNWAPFTCKVKRNIKSKCRNLYMNKIEKSCKVDQTIMKFMKALVNKGIRMASKVTDEIKSRRSRILDFIKQQFNILVLADLLED